MNKPFIVKAFLHTKKVLTHKFYVAGAMIDMGIPLRGLMHDMSKFSPTEFFESVKYYQGNRSPIDAAKEENGVSKAWLHHKGRNPSHYEYWVDYLDDGGRGQIMPFKYAVEMIGDYIGAGKAYNKKDWTYNTPLDYWMKTKYEKAKIHPLMKKFYTAVFQEIAANEVLPDKHYLKVMYEKIVIQEKEWEV